MKAGRPEQNIREIFLGEMYSQTGLNRLFDFIPDVHFLVKNRNFEFVMANQLFSEKCGCASEKEIIGKTDYDFFHEDLIKNYRVDDEFVVNTGHNIVNRIELVPNEDGTVDWYCTNKIPIYARTGEVIGLAAISKLLKKADISNHPHADMAQALSYISQNYANNIEKKALASMTGYSFNQFERRFKQAFNITPEKFINAVRIRAACKMLANSRESLKRIAYKTGICNQSYFSRQFRATMRMSPREYRENFFKGI